MGENAISREFAQFCKDRGISHEFTCPYAPEQNGVSERLNRTLIVTARSMIYHAKVPLKFWAEAVNTAVYLRNRSPTSALKDKTTFECWFGEKPDVSNLRVFGCICFVHTPDNLRKKLNLKSTKAIFVGYLLGTKGYKLYDLSSKRFIRSRNVLFYEQKFHDFEFNDEKVVFREIYESDLDNIEQPISSVEVEPTVSHNVPQQEMNVQPVGATYEETFMRQVDNLSSKRHRNLPQRFHPDGCLIADSLTIEVDEPKSVSEALSSEHSTQWREALNSEYQSLIDNGAWELVPPPEGKNIVGSKWVLKVKRDANGNLDRFKARLVAQGYSQTRGVDYDEVFSPVARYSAIRSLLAQANANDWEIHQMDVKTAFLNGSIDSEIYMSQLEGFVDTDHPNFVCKLKKSIYGLKQSARCWNVTLDDFLVSSGYRKSNADNCVQGRI